MADSIDRVFVHALNTLKKIPTTGAPRPPAADRLRLYGFFKQAREGDVDGVMARPTPASARAAGLEPEELQREQDKWDAWQAQRGLGRTEAKRRYIEALIETMHRYATTPDARDLAQELEFVWGQIKDNIPVEETRQQQQQSQDDDDGRTLGRGLMGEGGAENGGGGGMRVLSPMSEQDEADYESERRAREEEANGDDDGETRDDDGDSAAHDQRKRMRHSTTLSAADSNTWTRSVERALVQLSAEVGALREQLQLSTKSQQQHQQESQGFYSSVKGWIGWTLWAIARHVVADMTMLGLVLFMLRRRGDGRLEELVRGVARLGREYARGMVGTARARVRVRA